MDKFNVKVEFVVKAKDRQVAWEKARQICFKHLRDLATVTAVSTKPLPDPQEWIAINEPIKSQPEEPLGTGIYKVNVLGQRVEVPQKHIDAWCNLCQFPLESPVCSKESIQICWDKSGAIAGEWHKQHECPFLHKGIQQKLGYIAGKPEPCRCDEFFTIEEAFRATGIPYGK